MYQVVHMGGLNIRRVPAVLWKYCVSFLGMVRDTSVPKLNILSGTQDIWVAIARIELNV